jgi:uncharacterized protein YbaR (Trm112 family)
MNKNESLVMFKQYEILACPFCNKGEIQCLYYPESYTVRKVQSGKGKSSTVRKSSSQWIIQSGCNLCGKNLESIEKELKCKNVI